MPKISRLIAPDRGEMDFALRTELELRAVFHDVQLPGSASTSRLLLTYVVVVDKAVLEYASGRERLTKYAEAGVASHFIEGLGHFENCINSVKRALRLLDRLSSQSDAPAFDRTLRRLAQSGSASVTSVRDAIEHIDADILSPTGIDTGAPHLLTVEEDSEQLRIGSHRLQFVELHRTLTALFRSGHAMIQALPDGRGAS
jgi:hypothetical protein